MSQPLDPVHLCTSGRTDPALSDSKRLETDHLVPSTEDWFRTRNTLQL